MEFDFVFLILKLYVIVEYKILQIFIVIMLNVISKTVAYSTLLVLQLSNMIIYHITKYPNEYTINSLITFIR